MRPNESQSKTYKDLMRLLPEVAKIKIWWTLDEDGLPQFIDRLAMSGHDGQLLIEKDVEVEDPLAIDLDEMNPQTQELLARLPAAMMILGWIDEWSLEEEDGASIVLLPSDSHFGDELPTEWGSPSDR